MFKNDVKSRTKEFSNGIMNGRGAKAKLMQLKEKTLSLVPCLFEREEGDKETESVGG